MLSLGKILSSFFAFIGLCLLTGSLIVWHSTSDFIAHAVSVKAEVLVPVSEHQHGKYRFTDQQGQQHEFSPPETQSPPPFATGDIVDALYLPGAEDEAKLDRFFSLWGVTTILGAIGAGFFAMGGGFLWILVRGSRHNTDLLQTGIPIDTTSAEVVEAAITINGRSPYRIVTRWRNPLDQKTYTFKSELMEHDPSRLLDGGAIKVYYAPGNPKKYFMDVRFLEERRQALAV